MEDKLILLVEDNPHIMAINDAALHMRGSAPCRRKLHTSAGSCCAFTRWT